MAQRKKSEIEFIQDTFCPQVAVLCSYDAEVVCRKNALTFVELVQPFCRFNGEIKISDPSNNLCTISNLRVEIKDINAVPPQPLLAKKLLDESVSNGLVLSQNFVEKEINLNNYNFIANVNTPWFEAWRECFIKIGYPDDHEFLKHFLSCIFVVSTGHLDPLDQFQKLIIQQQQPQPPNRLPKWFFPNGQSIYKYFVLLHDVQEGEISKAHQIYENLKSTYGSSNCHLLQINSKQLNQQQQSLLLNQSLNNGTAPEFDPWLQYCKYNELYNNSIEHLNQEVGITNPLQTNVDEDPLSSQSTTTADEQQQEASTLLKRHGACLALSDHDRIKTLISEFLQRGLVPYVERTIKILNEQVQSKKSILKSFGIPRRIFGSSSSSPLSSSKTSAVVTITAAGLSSTSGTSGVATNNQSGVLTITNSFATNDELQLRRLADLAFMFRLYDLAYNSYHSCKKEFTSFINNNSNQSNTEHLLNMTLYLAGALEMASLSNFMQNFSGDIATMTMSNSTSSSSLSSSSSTTTTSSSVMNKSYNFQYIEEAIMLLLNQCKSNYFATRCALLSTEALKANNLFSKAAYQFISLSSDESDMRSALFLEQAAQCYLAMQQTQPWIRKYAFYMSIAGYRFSKAGQKKHALRVYKHALDIYENHNWFKAQDHLNFVMSRLCFNLKNVSDALNHIHAILLKKRIKQKACNYPRQQHAGIDESLIEFTNETNILKDFVLYSNVLQEQQQHQNLSILPLPLIDCKNIKVNLNPVDNLTLKYGAVLINDDSDFDYLHEPIGFNEREIQNNMKDNISVNTISINTHQSNNTDLRETWIRFEKALYVAAFKSLPVLFKSQISYFNRTTDNKQMPRVVVDETVAVMFEMKNHLKINVSVFDLTLLWKFVDQSGQQINGITGTNLNSSGEHSQSDSSFNNESVEITNESYIGNQKTIVECSSVRELTLAPFETYKIRLNLVPKRAHGHLHLLGVKYRLGLTSFMTSSMSMSTMMVNSTTGLTISKSSVSISGSESNNTETATTLHGKQMFEMKGSRLNNTQQAMRSVVYEIDNRLNFKIMQRTPLLQIEMDHLPNALFCNQLERIRVYFINLSNEMSIGNLRVASNGIATSSLFFDNPSEDVEINLAPNNLESIDNSKFQEKEISLSNESNLVYTFKDVTIKPNDRFELDMWLKAPAIECEQTFYLMFFYENASSPSFLPINTVTTSSPSSKFTKRNSVTSNTLKYRVAKYQFSIKTVNSLSNTKTKIIDSQSSPSMFLNMEISNNQHQTSFELVDSISVSDLWQAIPTQSSVENNILAATESTETQSNNSLSTPFEQSKLAKKNLEIVSLVFKTQKIKRLDNQDTPNEQKQVFFYRSYFKKETETNENSNVGMENFHKPNKKVLLYFLKSDLKTQFFKTSFNSSYLNVYLIWKSITKKNETENLIKYGLMPFKVIKQENDQDKKTSLDQQPSLTNQEQQCRFLYRPTSINNNLDLTCPTLNNFKEAKRLLVITSNYSSSIKFNFEQKNLCTTVVDIKLENLSSINDYELILIAKNSRNNDLEKKYLWLGCNKKCIKIKPATLKSIKFKLGFYSNGVFEIGKSVTEEGILFKTDFFNANNMKSSTLTQPVDYLNDYFNLETIPSKVPNNPVESASICVFLKNNSNNRFELLKKLSAFTVSVLNSTEKN